MSHEELWNFDIDGVCTAISARINKFVLCKAKMALGNGELSGENFGTPELGNERQQSHTPQWYEIAITGNRLSTENHLVQAFTSCTDPKQLLQAK